jgi:outer membrane protein TolC
MTRLPASLVLVALLATWPSSAAADGPGQLELDEVLASVDKHYPLLRAAGQERAIAEGELRSANGSAFDPSWVTRAQGQPVGYYGQWQVDSTVTQYTPVWGATAFVGYRFGDDMPLYYGDRLTKQAGEIRGGVTVPVWRNGPTDRRRSNIWKAEAGIDAAGLSVEQQRLLYGRDASFRYWDWVSAARKREIAEALLAIAVQRDAQVAARAAAGDVPTIERTDNSRLIVQRQGLVAATERDLQKAAIELSLYLRDDAGKPLVPDVSRAPRSFPEPVPIDAHVVQRDADAALARRPEVRRLDALGKQQDLELEYARNQKAPAIDVFVTGSYDLGDSRVARPDLDKPVVAAGVLVDIPILNRAADGRSKAAEAAKTRIAEQRRFASDRIRADVQDATSALEAARLRAAVARREVDLARQLEDAERTRFDAGDSSLLIVNLREQASAEARAREVDALADYAKARAAYRAATATVTAAP